jgi:hypothetical protein
MSDHDVVANFDGEQCAFLLFGSRIFHELAEDAALRRKNIGEPRRQIVKRNCRREQRIERGIPEKVERRGKAACMRPAGAMRRRDLADLT